MPSGALEGYLAILVAAVFFGSSYVPVKHFPTGPDGLFFQWMLCVGVLIIGAATAPFQSSFPILPREGFLGGGLWAVGNLLTVPTVSRIGLAKGFLMWSG